MTSKDDLALVLLYANWCGACKNFYIKDGETPKHYDKLEEHQKINSWQAVKKNCKITTFEFESEVLKNGKDEVNKDGFNLVELNKMIEHWPTIIMFKKENGKYVKVKELTEGGRSTDNINKFIEECSKEVKQTGGSADYKKKYKKYKHLYADLLEKYNKIK